LFCREEVHRLWARKAELDALGVSLACVVKEFIPEQIAQFQPAFWGDDHLYLDEDMSFYKALGGGEVVKKGVMALGSKAVRKHNARSKAYMAEHKLDSNLKGEGLIMGGCYVLKAGGGGVVMQKNEETFGDIATVDETIDAARVAAIATQTGDTAPSEPAPEPAAESPPVELAAEPAEEPVVEPAAESVLVELAAEPAAEPVAESVVKSATELAAEPVAEPAAGPASEPAAEPIVMVEPTVEEESLAVVEPESVAATEVTSMPSADEGIPPESAVGPQPTADPAATPVV
jgi:hypothetical protein